MCAEIEAITIADIACPHKKAGKKVDYPFSILNTLTGDYLDFRITPPCWRYRGRLHKHGYLQQRIN